MKTIKFKTLGCKVNQYDTQQIRKQFLDCGLRDVGGKEKADIYVINTCTVTANADRKSRYLINHYLRENAKAEIVVTGCLADASFDELILNPAIRKIVKNKDKSKIAQACGYKPTDFSDKHCDHSLISDFSKHTRAFIKVQDGCDNFCSYCRIPFVRGKPKSRKIKEIILEVKSLAAKGFKEIVLCGICLGKYGKDLKTGVSLIDLFKAIESVEGIARIRLSSIEPQDVTTDFIRIISRSGKFCHHLHIPLQSGDDDILKKMHRKYNSREYLQIVAKLRKSIPGIAITTDCLVGFPGEEEANFENSLKMIRKIMPLKVHIFPYSRRPGTFAAKNFRDEIAAKIINQRVNRLKNISQESSLEYRRKFIGSAQEVLFEMRSDSQPGYWIGHTGNYLKVAVKSNKDLANRLLPVILKTIKNDFIVGDFS